MKTDATKINVALLWQWKGLHRTFYFLSLVLFHLRERGWAILGFPHLVMVSSLFQNLFQNRSDITLLKTIFTVGIEYHTVLVVITDRYLE